MAIGGTCGAGVARLRREVRTASWSVPAKLQQDTLLQLLRLARLCILPSLPVTTLLCYHRHFRHLALT